MDYQYVVFGLVARNRKAGAKNVCVGIGVSTAEQGARVGSYADGVIVGSALVHTMLDESGKHAVDETPRIVRNDFQTVFGGIRRYQEDAVESVTVGGFDPLAGLVRNEIRGDETGSTGVFEITFESFDAVMEDEVPIAHDQWHSPGVRHCFHRFEYVGDFFTIVDGD